MLRGEQLRQLWAEDRECWDAEERGQMSGAGVVADETVGRGERREQGVDVLRVVLEDRHRPARGAEFVREGGKAVARPTPHCVSCADVNHDVVAGGARRLGRHGWFKGRQAQLLRQVSPVLGAMRIGRARESFGQQQAGAGSRVTESSMRPAQGQQDVIARVGTCRSADVEMARAKFGDGPAERSPRPVPQAIFSGERRPRSRQWNMRHLGRETAQEGRGVRLGEKGDVCDQRGSAQKRQRKRNIAKSPEFKDEQAEARRGFWRRFCQARGVKF